MPETEIPNDEISNSSPDSSISSESNSAHIEHQNIRLRLSNSFNYDSDNLDGIREEFFPAQAYLLPVVLPQRTEPTLDELLRRVTGRENLQDVSSVNLRVISSMVSLSRLSLFMPRLTSLNLDGSVLNSLRDLGYNLTHLTYLSVNNCGLSSLDGVSGMPMIEVLSADGNMIQLVGPLGGLPLLKRLSLKDNRIRDLPMLTFLGLCPNLLEVELQGNPVTNYILYRNTIEKNVKSLEILDGEPFQVNRTEIAISSVYESNSDEKDSSISTLSEDPLSDCSDNISNDNNSIVSIPDYQRPATSHGVNEVIINKTIMRPQTSSSSSDNNQRTHRRPLTSGNPLVGSVLQVARQRAHNLRSMKSAWEGSNSSSSSSSLSGYETTNPNQFRTFPNQLPQSKVPLESGVLSLNDDDSATQSESDENISSSLNKITRKWRNETKRKQNPQN